MNRNNTSAAVFRWLAQPLPQDVARSIERLASADDVQHIAVMPDVHLSGDVCVGLAVATTHLIYPAAVGGDIGCGMAALPLLAEAEILRDGRQAMALLQELRKRIPSIRHSRRTMPIALSARLASHPLSHPRLEKLKLRDGLVQLGTLGRGNHFAELQADDEGGLWLMLHSGSRGMGQAISQHHLALASAGKLPNSLVSLEAAADEGRAYLADAAWAIAYAEQSRIAMIRAICEVIAELFRIEADESRLIHCNHNHVRQEMHSGRLFWVHRKGALPASEGLPGIIPGSMGAASYHVSGRGCRQALCSSSHGAGRALSRGEAMKKISVRQLEREMKGVWFDSHLADRLRDEAPSAYKEIGAVMRAQKELTRIERRLRPLLSFKGG